MRTSGASNEGWMTVVPLAVLILTMIYVMGGPDQFANTVGNWATDAVGAVSVWLKHL